MLELEVENYASPISSFKVSSHVVSGNVDSSKITLFHISATFHVLEEFIERNFFSATAIGTPNTSEFALALM